MPLAFLMNPENHQRGSRVLLGAPRYFYEMPFEGHYIWGITAGIIRGALRAGVWLMARLLAFNALFFLLPFAVYAVWLRATRGTVNNAADWQGRTIAYLALGGAVIMLGAILAFTSFEGAPPGGVYHPATLDQNGRLVPGTID